MKEKVTFNDGVHNINNNEYHNSNGFSRSQLLSLDKSPYHFWYEHLSGKASIKEPTEAMIMGSAIHTLILQPELFHNEYAILPKIDRRTTSGKEQYEQFTLEVGNKTILTQEQFSKINCIEQSIRQHDIVDTLLKNALYEQSIFWTDKDTGLQFKVRPDAWSHKMVVDLKTSDDVNRYRFAGSAYKLGYYLQAAMIWQACNSIDKPFDVFTILAIEKKEPYAPAVFIINKEAIDFGLDQFQNYKEQLKQALDYNQWESYPVCELEVPKYATINNNLE